jgi:hypothetical protein
MAKLYLIAVDHDGKLKPTFQTIPLGLRMGAMDVLDLDEARAMSGEQFRVRMEDLARVMREAQPKKGGRLKEPEPDRYQYDPPPPASPRAPELPMADHDDPDSWRNELP